MPPKRKTSTKKKTRVNKKRKTPTQKKSIHSVFAQFSLTSRKDFRKLFRVIKTKKNKGKRTLLGIVRSNVHSLLIILGVFLILFPYIQNHLHKKIIEKQQIHKVNDQEQLSMLESNYGSIKISEGLLQNTDYRPTPLRIIIPSRNIDLPIVEANIIDGYWELSETTASHGLGSAHPGEIGNMVIFAHAREGLFLPIREMKRDEQIYVLTKDTWYRYAAKDIKEVTPDQVEVIAPTENETLTLFTCSGFLDSKRIIIHAKPYYP